MAKFTLDLDMDGYETEEEMIEACKEFIYDQLSFSGSGVGNIRHVPDEEEVFVLLADGDGTTRSRPTPFGVAVRSEEEAKAFKFNEESNVGYSHDYEKVTLFDKTKEGVHWKYHGDGRPEWQKKMDGES